MFILLAVIFFVLAAFSVDHVWIFGTTALGLVFLAAHFLLDSGVPWRRRQ